MSDKAWLYRSTVYHERFGEKHNAFRYPSLFLCFPLSQRQSLRSRLFGLNGFNLFSFHDADHGGGEHLEFWIRGVLAAQGVTQASGEVWLMTLPRILGFVFNPVSFWFCHDDDGALRAVLCEVNNTFGERHCYLVTAPNEAVITPDMSLICDKVFHVSPFYPVSGEYHFRFVRSAEHCAALIDYCQEGELALKTAVSGRATPLTDANLLQSFFSLGFATAMVVMRIHWQALRLFFKGARFHRKPEPPHKEISP